jgi:hypothetical protein
MNITFELKNTSDVTREEEELLNASFSESFDMRLPCANYFQWKYRENPFGQSRHLFAYADNVFAGCRSFWNLGFTGGALQCVDSFTNTKLRGVGVFKLGTEYLLKDYNLNFYNAPNSISRRQYLKYGWRISSILKPKIAYFKTICNHAPEIKWTHSQIKWRYKCHPYFTYMQVAIKEKYFIFRIKKGVPVLLGYVTSDPGLPGIQRARIILSAYYGAFPGLGIEFGGLTSVLVKGFEDASIDSYWLDMF